MPASAVMLENESQPRAAETGFNVDMLSVTPAQRQPLLVGYISKPQSIKAPPSQDDIHTLLASSLVVIT